MSNKNIKSGVAGSEVLIIYLAMIGASEVEKTLDIKYVDLLLKSGANVNLHCVVLYHWQFIFYDITLI